MIILFCNVNVLVPCCLFYYESTPFPKILVYHASLPYVKYSCPSELDLQNMTAKDQRIYWQMLLITAIDPLDNSRQCASTAS